MKTWIVLICLLAFFPAAHAEWQETQFNKESVYTYYPEAVGQKAIMFNLHGCNQDNLDMVKYANWVSTAEDHNMIVVVPQVPDGGVFFNCWNYFGSWQSTKSSHAKHVLDLVQSFLNNTSLNIDPNQVYISGFSSGGAMSMVLTCLRPDLFAGVGAASAPSIGTAFYESTFPATSGKSAASLCQKFAKKNKQYLKSLVSSMVHGDVDKVVHVEYNNINANMFVRLSEKNLVKREFDLNEVLGFFNEGTGTLWSDLSTDRVSLIMNRGIGHNWPAGSGDNALPSQRVIAKSINYPKYLTEFLIENNLRKSSTIIE